MPSNQILDKLFDVEKKAETIVSSARDEASRRIGAGKEASEAAFKQAYEAKVSELEKKLDEEQKAADREFDQTVEQYRTALASAGEDRKAFGTLCGSILASEGQRR